jgi:hypothetical protein
MRIHAVGILAFIGGLVVVLLFVAAGIATYYRIGSRQVPSRTFLEANFEKKHVECIPEDRLGKLVMKDAPLLRDLVQALPGRPKIRGLTASLQKWAPPE